DADDGGPGTVRFEMDALADWIETTESRGGKRFADEQRVSRRSVILSTQPASGQKWNAQCLEVVATHDEFVDLVVKCWRRVSLAIGTEAYGFDVAERDV